MTTTTPARVVVVDDSALMRNIVTRSLTRAAVDALAEGAFDLVSKPTATESLEAFIENLGAKVKLAAASRRTRRSAHNGGAHIPSRPAGPAHDGARVIPTRRP